MKKVFSVVLTVVMLFAVCIPAFAADVVLDQNTLSDDVIIKTSTVTESGESGETFEVIIQAETIIKWGAVSTNLVYTVESHLGYGKHLEVTAAGSGTMKLAEDVSETLAYTLADINFTATSPVVYPAADVTAKVNVTENDWLTAIVGEYADTVTFTAVIA